MNSTMKIPAARWLPLLLLLAACGGDGETPGPAPDPASPPAGPSTGAAPGQSAPAAAPSPAGLPEVEFAAQHARPPAVEPAPPAADPADPAAEAVAALEARLADDPDDLQVLRELGRSLIDVGRKQEAVPLFERAARLDPGPRSRLELGIAYATVSRLGEAEAAYRQVLEAMPNHPPTLHNLGNLAVKRGDHEAAIEWYARAIEADPGYMLAYLHIAQAFEAVGRSDRAYAAYLTILDEMRPRNPREQGVYNEAVFELGKLALSLGQAEQAASLLGQLVQASPDHVGAHYSLGQALLELGREEEAQREFETHMRILADRAPTGAVASEPEIQ